MIKQIDNNKGVWDRSAAITLLLAIFIQAISFVWWFSGLSMRVDSLETDSKLLISHEWAVGKHTIIESNISHISKRNEKLGSSIVRVEEKMNKIYLILLKMDGNNNENM